MKGISPRVIWPSDASTCQRRRYAPTARPVASAESISAGVCLLISSACAEPSGRMSVKRERSASIRTLKRSLTGTSGPDTALFSAGLDSRRTACAEAGATINREAAVANRINVQRFRRPGCMTLLFAKSGEELCESWATTAGRKLYRRARGLPFHSEAGAQTGLPLRAAEEQKKSAGAVRAEVSGNYSCELISLLWFQSIVGSDAGS